jgi:hypothetical protein
MTTLLTFPTTTTKVQATVISIEWAEGDPEFNNLPKSFDVGNIWEAANLELIRLSSQAPKMGGYTKTDFIVYFADGEKYEGRLDIKHFSCQDNDTDLAEHILQHNRFYAGQYKPDHMTADEYTRFVTWDKETKVQCLNFLLKYEIGETVPDDRAAFAYRMCAICGEGFGISDSLICFECATTPTIDEPPLVKPVVEKYSSPVFAMTYKEQAELIRKAIKKVVPTVSVTCKRGWVHIYGGTNYASLTNAQVDGLKPLGFQVNHGWQSVDIRDTDLELWVLRLNPDIPRTQADMVEAERRAAYEYWD